MQLVFVHGVATRSTKAYLAEEKQRDEFFRKACFTGQTVTINNPKWGDLVGEPYWGNASMPTNDSSATAFSSDKAFGLDAVFGSENSAGAEESKVLPQLAMTSLEAAVDALAVSMVDQARKKGEDLDSLQMQFFIDAARYLETTQDTSWINNQLTDEGFAMMLVKKVTQDKSTSLNIDTFMKDAVTGISDRLRNMAGLGLTAGFRDELNPLAGKFLCDVFVYLKDSSKRKEIRDCIRADLMKAFEGKANGEPVVVVGHSMGGVILVDMLSDPAEVSLLKNKIDLLVTVGSQPGFFEEYKLFEVSDRNIGKDKKTKIAPALLGAKVWWNVYDPVDILSFKCVGIFEEVTDFEFSSAVGLLDAHTAYFKRPKFFERLRERAEKLVIQS